MFYTKSNSNKAIATCSFNLHCLCKSSKAKSFIILIPWSVKFDCLKIPGSVIDSNNNNDRSCLTSSNITAKQASI